MNELLYGDDVRIYKTDMIRSIITNRENRSVMASIEEAKESDLMNVLKHDLKAEFSTANQALYEKHGSAIFDT